MLTKNIITISILFVLIPNTSHAYIDPVSISYLITIMMSGFIAFILQLKRINTYIKQLLIKLHIIKDNNKEEKVVLEEVEISTKNSKDI